MPQSYPMSTLARNRRYDENHREDHVDRKLGRYYTDKDGRKIFTNEKGQEYYIGEFEGKPHPVILLPGYMPRVRPKADIGGAQSIGNGGYRRGGVAGNN